MGKIIGMVDAMRGILDHKITGSRGAEVSDLLSAEYPAGRDVPDIRSCENCLFSSCSGRFEGVICEKWIYKGD